MYDVFEQELKLGDFVFIVDRYKEIDVGRVIGFTNTKVRVSLKGGRGTILVTSNKVGLKNTSITKSNTKEV